MASSPRSSRLDPPRASRIGRATAANLPASSAAASSPCSCVKTVYPRTSAIRNVRMWARPSPPLFPPTPSLPSPPPPSLSLPPPPSSLAPRRPPVAPPDHGGLWSGGRLLLGVRSVSHPEQAPAVGDALELVFAGVLEVRPLNRRRDPSRSEETSTSEAPAGAQILDPITRRSRPPSRRSSRPRPCARPLGSRSPSAGRPRRRPSRIGPRGRGRRTWRRSRRPAVSTRPRAPRQVAPHDRVVTSTSPARPDPRAPTPSGSSRRCR